MFIDSPSTMYWVDAGSTRSYRRPKIEMAAMDGTERVTLITRGLSQPLTLVVFHPLNQASKAAIYWTDRRKRVIEKASLNGKNRTIAREFCKRNHVEGTGCIMI